MGEESQQLPWFLGLEGIKAYEQQDNYVVLDFETTNLQKGSFTNPDNQLVLACWTVVKDGKEVHKSKFGNEYEQSELLKDIKEARFVVAHNAQFELGWLSRCGVDLHDILCYCTMVGEWVIQGNRKVPLNLEDTATRYGYGGKESLVSMLINKGVDPAEIPQSWLLKYCKIDVSLCHKLFLAQHPILTESNLWHIILSRNLTIPVLVDIQENGLQLDEEEVYKEEQKLQETIESLGQELDKITGGINLGSPKQLGVLLYETLGFEELRDRDGNKLKTPSGGYSTAEVVIYQLKATTDKQRKFLELYKDYNQAVTLLTKNVAFFSNVCKYNEGVFYGQIGHGRTGTHRLASSGIKVEFPSKTKAGKPTTKEMSCQIQNLPRQYKKFFTSHDPDWEVLEADGAGMEFRTAGILGKDKQAEYDIVNGTDVHAFTRDTMNAAYIKYNIDIQIDRQEAKSSCVPMDSQILTRSGWKDFYSVQEGEMVCTYNAESKVLEWKPLLEKVTFDDVEVVEMTHGHSWSVRSTGNHRWYGDKLVDRGHFKERVDQVFTTDEITQSHRITVSAPMVSEPAINCTPSDAALIGWIATDGYLKVSPLTYNRAQGSDGRRRAVNAVIIQKKAEGIAHITKMLKASGITPVISEKDGGCLVFKLSSPDARDLYTRSGLGLDNPDEALLEWLLAIPDASRDAFLEAANLAEGWTHSHGTRRIAQNVGPVKEAIHLAAYLKGHDVRVTLTPKDRVPRANFDHASMTLRNKPYVGCSKLVKTSLGKQQVWCPRTANNTWVMRQGETVTITGNTFTPLFWGMGKDKAEAEYAKAFKEKYWGIYATQKDWVIEVASTKKLVTPYGMIFYWPNVKMYQSGYVSNSTEIVNIPIQGLATGEIIPVALVHFWHRVRNLPVKIFNTVHDSIVSRVRKDVLEEAKRLSKIAMTTDVYRFFDEVYDFHEFGTLPLGVGMKSGPSWGVSNREEIYDVWYSGDERLTVEENKVKSVVYDTRTNKE